MVEPEHRLQVLIANEQHARLEKITALVEALGHEIVGSAVDISEVGPLSRSTAAEVALVGLGLDGEHALEQITQIVHEAAWNPRNSKAPSTSRSGASRSSRACRVRSVAARSSNKPKAFSWNETASTPTQHLVC